MTAFRLWLCFAVKAGTLRNLSLNWWQPTLHSGRPGTMHSILSSWPAAAPAMPLAVPACLGVMRSQLTVALEASDHPPD